jgi:hypothetical protein
MGGDYVRQSVKLQPGDHCFWGGHEYIISGSSSKDQWVLFRADGSVSWNAIVVARRQVEPLAKNIFKIGDRVESQHTFTGKVMGYEPETNRVVCMSDKLEFYKDLLGPGSGQRARWSYKVWEIQLSGEQLTLSWDVASHEA